MYSLTYTSICRFPIPLLYVSQKRSVHRRGYTNPIFHSNYANFTSTSDKLGRLEQFRSLVLEKAISLTTWVCSSQATRRIGVRGDMLLIYHSLVYYFYCYISPDTTLSYSSEILLSNRRRINTPQAYAPKPRFPPIFTST